MPGPKQKKDAVADDTRLTRDETRQAERRTAPRAAVVYEAIRLEAEDELSRPGSALFFSGLAAGLSMGFSMMVEGLLQSRLPDTAWRPLVSKFGYTIGFLIVVLARQQLFTENTLTPIIQLLRRPSLAVLLGVARLWCVVLTANLLGALIFAWVAGATDLFDVGTHRAFVELGRHTMANDFGTTLISGIFAGWLIALMVWLLPFADTARVSVIILITYVVGIGGFSHSIAGSIEALYLVTTGAATIGEFTTRFFLPTLLGNIVGGVALVAVINHAQVVAGGGIED